MKTIEKVIKELEERLLHEDARSNSETLNKLLADEFEEIGVSGRVTSRKEVIDWLVNKEQNIQWSLDNFQIRLLAPTIVLAKYEAHKKDKKENSTSGSMRSSIWRLYDEQWKIEFHQGTRIEGNDDS